MSKAGDEIRAFLIEHLEDHPTDIVRLAAEHFGCTRQAVHKHMRRLISEGKVSVHGNTRNRQYSPAILNEWNIRVLLQDGIAEDALWQSNVAPALNGLSKDVRAIWCYGFTEMFNNVIDHSEAIGAIVSITRTATSVTISIFDDGIGIFKKIQTALSLADERHAVLELVKGKFTTDPARHSGEGIFFTSRVMDEFAILSGSVVFSHEFNKEEDWILERRSPQPGTMVVMRLQNHTSRLLKDIHDQFTATEEDSEFNKTVVPVSLMKYGDDNLVSRSQAKRLLARIDRFKTVVLDFSGVATIGQAFADEIFRVFRRMHPEVEIVHIQAADEVLRMISRAEALGEQQRLGQESQEPRQE